jgi:hypothetical protein
MAPHLAALAIVHPLIPNMQYANSAFALASQFYVMRIGRFYAVSKTFGPILLMIKLMLVCYSHPFMRWC